MVVVGCKYPVAVELVLFILLSRLCRACTYCIKSRRIGIGVDSSFIEHLSCFIRGVMYLIHERLGLVAISATDSQLPLRITAAIGHTEDVCTARASADNLTPRLLNPLKLLENLTPPKQPRACSCTPPCTGPHFMELDALVAGRDNYASLLHRARTPQTPFFLSRPDQRRTSGRLAASSSGPSFITRARLSRVPFPIIQSVRLQLPSWDARIADCPQSSSAVSQTVVITTVEAAPLRTPRNGGDLLATGPREHCDPNGMLWLCIPKGSSNFVPPLAPDQTSYLRVDVDGC